MKYKIYYKLDYNCFMVYTTVIDNPYKKPEWLENMCIVKIEEVEVEI